MDSEDEDDFVPVYEQESEPDNEEAFIDQDDASDTDGSSSNRCAL